MLLICWALVGATGCGSMHPVAADSCPIFMVMPHAETAAGPEQAEGTVLAVSRTPVTVRQWASCVEAGGCGGYRPEVQGWSIDSPVVNVSRRDALRYAKWLGEKMHVPIRLPREDEWSWLVLAGTPGPYPWGALLGHGQTNCLDCGSPFDGRSTSPVDAFEGNAAGLRDTAGNVAQWLLEPLDARPSRCASQPGTAGIGGASWADPARFLLSDAVTCVWQGLRDDTIGFRVVAVVAAVHVNIGDSIDCKPVQLP